MPHQYMTEHVVLLSLAEQLKEAGYPQERSTFFQWLPFIAEKSNIPHVFYQDENGLTLVGGVWYEDGLAAPIASELGNQLPSNLDEFVRENLDDLSTDLYFDWCNTDHPYFNPDLLAKLWLLLREKKLL